MTTDAPSPSARALPLRAKLLYSVGYFGVSTLSGLFLLWANYRYGMLLSGAQKVWVGVALLVAQLLNAPVDAVVGYWSDRTRSRLGRRRPFVAYGTLPLIVSFALVWVHPAGVGSLGNVVWLLVLATVFFNLFSVVVNPYLAMLPDIARSDADRVTTSALLAAFGLAAEVATMVGGSLLAGLTSFTIAVAVASAVGGVCLMLPLLVREETPPEQQAQPEFGLWLAIRETLANGPFRIFLVSKCLYWLGIRTAIAVVPFFVVGALGFEEGDVETQTGLLLAFAVAPAFVWFALMKALVRRFSKRLLSLAGLACLALTAALMATVGLTPIPPLLQARLLAVSAGFPIAVLFAVPTAILADIVDLDERRTGSRREAMYFGAQGFFVKVSWGGAAALVMAAQGLLAHDAGAAARASWLAVAVTAALALAAFARFPADAELAALARPPQQP